MNACPVDADGYCAWEAFVQALNRAQKETAAP